MIYVTSAYWVSLGGTMTYMQPTMYQSGCNRQFCLLIEHGSTFYTPTQLTTVLYSYVGVNKALQSRNETAILCSNFVTES